MVNKEKNFFLKHKYAIFIFVFMLVYNFAIVKNFSFPRIDDITYAYHLVDFSLGFCTKLLPGAIYNALLPSTKVELVNIYFLVIYHIFLLAVSFMLEAFLKSFNSEGRFPALIMVLFFITGPATFSIHTYHLGILDTYWLFFSVLFLTMIQNRILKWFVPVLFVLSIFIHVSAIISFVPFFALIILLEATRSTKRSGYSIIFTVSVGVSIITFLYFTISEGNNLNLNLDEFRNFISERNLSEWDEYTKYYDYSLYRISYLDDKPIVIENAGNNSGFLTNAIGPFLLQVKETFRCYLSLDNYYKSVACDLLVSLPVIVFLYKYVIHKFKTQKANRGRAFIWFCSLLLFPLTFIVGCLCSPDITRWFGHGVILLYTLVMYEIYKSDSDYLKESGITSNNFSLIGIGIYFILYMSCIVDPYC